MAYMGNAAYQLDVYGQTAVPARRPLSVHEGGGLDARSRGQQMTQLMALVRIAAIVAVVLCVVAGIRVALIAQTVTVLREVNTAQAAVSEERDMHAQLQVEHSKLTSADRIQRIATENYGMVYASDVDTISLSSSATQDEDADGMAEAQAPEEGDANAALA